MNRLLAVFDIKDRDYRFIPFGVVSLIFASFLFSEYYLGSYAVVGKYFAIHPMPYFHDLDIWVGGIDSWREGSDPYEVGGRNKHAAYFNYPSAWLVFSFIPVITKSNLVEMGLVIVLLFFFSLYFFVEKCDLLSALVYTSLFISPAVILAIERGNCDLIIFLLLMFVLLMSNVTPVFTLLMIMTSMLKLFPVGAFIGILNNVTAKTKTRFFLFLTAVFAFVVYLFVWKDNLLVVNKQTPRPFGGYSFGLGEIPNAFLTYFPSDSDLLKFTSFLTIYVLSLLLSYVIFKTWSTPQINPDAKGTAYLIGSGIFIVACVFGFNFEYRLIFLLFTVPQLLSWTRQKNVVASLGLIFSILITWQSFIEAGLNSLYLQSLHYHYISQVFIAFLFSCHVVIMWKFLYSLYKENFHLSRNG
jgi:hypothetical protein